MNGGYFVIRLNLKQQLSAYFVKISDGIKDDLRITDACQLLDGGRHKDKPREKRPRALSPARSP